MAALGVSLSISQMSNDASLKFFSEQKNAVARIGALITDIEGCLNEIMISKADSVDEKRARRMLPILNNFRKELPLIAGFFGENNLEVYLVELTRQISRLSTRFGEQTLPSKARAKGDFVSGTRQNVNAISEIMIATAKSDPPTVEVDVKANNAFSAYLLLSDLIERCEHTLIVVDPYIDDSLFYRYLYRTSSSGHL